MCKFLIGHGANINAKDDLKATPLHTAAISGNHPILLLL